MLRILLANGQRSGVLFQITPSAIERAATTPDVAVITVSLTHFFRSTLFAVDPADCLSFNCLFQISRHKTGYIGPANIAFPEPLWARTLAYFKSLQDIPGYHVRLHRKESIFMKFPCGLEERPIPLSSSGIQYAINQLWKCAHARKVISATRLRKSIVTHVRKQQPHARSALALHMSHNEVTADRYYNLQRRREMAIPMSTLINSTMTQSGQETVGTSGSLAIEDAPPSSSPKAIHNTLDSSECRTLSEVPSTSGMHEGQILPVEYQLPPAEDTDSDSDPDEHPVVKRSKTEIPTHVRLLCTFFLNDKY